MIAYVQKSTTELDKYPFTTFFRLAISKFGNALYPQYGAEAIGQRVLDPHRKGARDGSGFRASTDTVFISQLHDQLRRIASDK